MSLSKEWFDYHLTPEGWIEGGERIDFGKTTEKLIPSGRALCRFDDMKSYPMHSISPIAE